MIKKLFLPLTIFLFTSSFLSAQSIDQDGQNVGIVECNNVDSGDFMDDIEVILLNSTWTSPDCGSVTYDDNFTITSSPPYDCNGTDVVEVEVDLDCDGSIVTILVLLNTEDMLDPFDHNTDNSLEDPTISGEQCTMNLQSEIDAWITNIENNSFNGCLLYTSPSPRDS